MKHNTELSAVPQGGADFIREGNIVLSPLQAQTVLQRYRYDKNRDELKAKAHIRYLAESMRRGVWTPRDQIAFARKPSGALTLINGHHRMRAQIEAGKNIEWNIVIYDVKDDAELASIYSRFDTGTRVRSRSNIVAGIGLDDRTGLTRQYSNALFGAADIISLGFRSRVAGVDGKAIIDDQMELALKYADEALQLERLMKVAPPKVGQRLRNTLVFAVALVTMRYAPDQASDFWGGIATDDGLRRLDPRKVFLLDMENRTSNTAGMQTRCMVAARAWNAWYEGRQVNALKITGRAIPIKGTPFTVPAR